LGYKWVTKIFAYPTKNRFICASFITDLSEEFSDLRLLKDKLKEGPILGFKFFTLRTFLNTVKNSEKKNEYLNWLQRFEQAYCEKVVK